MTEKKPTISNKKIILIWIIIIILCISSILAFLAYKKQNALNQKQDNIEEIIEKKDTYIDEENKINNKDTETKEEEETEDLKSNEDTNNEEEEALDEDSDENTKLNEDNEEEKDEDNEKEEAIDIDEKKDTDIDEENKDDNEDTETKEEEKEKKDDDKMEKTELTNVMNDNKEGEIKRQFEDDTFTLQILTDLDNPGKDFHYEAWLIKIANENILINIGDLKKNQNEKFSLNFKSKKNYLSYNQIAITLEPDDADPDPSAKIAEATFK